MASVLVDHSTDSFALWAAKHGVKETNRFGPVPEIGGRKPD